MSIISAEITKLSLNSYVTMKISFANTLAAICEAVPGADIDAITAALGADRRIAPSYLKGGLSYGGPCFPRDNRAFAAFAREQQQEAVLAQATDAVNRARINQTVRKIMSYLETGTGRSVAILGLAYKANTSVIEESAGVKIIEELLRDDVEIIAYDPIALDNARGRFGDNILYSSSVRECFSQSSLCVITTMADNFREISADDIVHNPTTIIDCWRMLDPSRFGDKVRYVALGRNASWPR